MIITEPLERVLTEPCVRELDLADRELETVLTLASQDRFLPAAELSQSLWQRQIYDVRTIGTYLFGVFFERGVSSLSLIFECVTRALRENLQYLSPTHKRDRHLDTSLRWLFDSIVTQARFHERQKDAVWAKWNDDWQRTTQQHAIERCTGLLATIDEILPGGRARQPLFHLQSLLEGMARASAVSAGWEMKGATQVPAPPPPPESKSSAGDENETSDTGDDDSRSQDDEPASSSSSDSSNDDDGNHADDDEAKSSSEDESKSEDDEEKPADDDDDDKKDDDDDKNDDDDDDDKEDDDDDADDTSKDSGSSSSGSSSKSSSGSSSNSHAGSSGPPPPSAQPLSSQSFSQPMAGSLNIMPSAPLQALLQELAGFVQLIEGRRYRNAAIILQQIRQTLESFEPTRFFPTLFTDYLLALAQHGEKLKPHLDGDVDLEQEALRQLCRADLARFLSHGEH